MNCLLFELLSLSLFLFSQVCLSSLSLCVIQCTIIIQMGWTKHQSFSVQKLTHPMQARG